MRIYYRISDNSYPKAKLPGATKHICLINFLKAFKEVIFEKDVLDGRQKPPMTIIADRCEEETTAMAEHTGLPIVKTNFGNAGSLHFAIDRAIQECHEGELAYFVEDDYLHLANAPHLLREGMLHADYITLYDHPDKYTNIYNLGEESKVVRTSSSHWRYTISTCMTFAAKVKILREDVDVFKKHTGTVEQEGEHPVDHEIFCELKEKDRKLAVCIPGAACHTDLSFSAMAGAMMIEPWAIQTMINELEEQLKDIEKRIKAEDKDEFSSLKKSVLAGKEGWGKLVGLDALLRTVH